MVYWLSEYLMRIDSSFAVLQYITVRAAFSVITALVVSLIFGPAIIERLNLAQVGQVVREDGPQTHFEKGRHADHGWPADPAQHRHQHPAVVGTGATTMCGSCSA